MSMDLKPNFDVKALSKQAEMFPKSGSAALNRVAREAKTKVTDEITTRYNIKKSDVSSKMTIVTASQSNLVARLKVVGRRLTAYRFSARESALAHGVVVTIIKGQSKVIATAFINKVNGMKMVLKRKTKKRYPVDAVRTISVPEMAGSKKIGERFNELVSKRLPEELKRLIDVFGK